ncbi:MAG: mandelate racemase/muconate lactonizing enzyme family protein [Planctomycetota bacterium]
MKCRRRTILKAGVAGAIAPCALRSSAAVEIPGGKPMLDLPSRIRCSVPIESIEQLRVGDAIWFRVRSSDGAVGVCPGNDRLKMTVEMARRLVIPFFIGKDARDIEALVDGVYTSRDERGSVYKYAGMPFWNVVGHVEGAVFDMMGRITDAPVSDLLVGAVRSEIDVYISRFGRETSAQQEVENAANDLAQTGARATKLKVGLRMRNSPLQMQRDRKMIELARRTFGDDVAIYVDANSSYPVDEAKAMGRHFEANGVGLFEEPLPWQDYRGTKQVTDALEMPVAGGEQDSSLWQWREMVDRRIVDVVQPDVFYNGGMVRTLRVAKMAERAGMRFTPHSPTVLPRAAVNLHLCSVVPNLGPFQEYRSFGKVSDGKVAVPTGPGLGLEVDEGELRKAKPL